MVKVGEYIYEIPADAHAGMNVPGRIYASEAILKKAQEDKALEQVVNVATLPGILKYSLAMPDIHWGYGFPIGGVAAFDLQEGVITPGGIGFDINCGVRMLRTPLTINDVVPHMDKLLDALFREVPSGVGSEGFIKLRGRDLDSVLSTGAHWSVKNGYGLPEDLAHTESSGFMSGANPDKVSQKAKERGSDQLGTLGSGNHFLEIQVVDELFDEQSAKKMGLSLGQVTVMFHTGSRGLGHQVATDYIEVMLRASKKYGIKLVDKQLAAAPFNTPEGQDYWAAMQAAANFAWANRQVITHYIRKAFETVFGKAVAENLVVVYDVAHNIAKIEEHIVNGNKRKVLVHRKGATRAFPAGHPEVPESYRDIGQPVIIPGDMGRTSFLLLGLEGSMAESWGSTCHGAGRLLSRKEAVRRGNYGNLMAALAEKGIKVKSAERETLLEEAPDAYKDVAEVVLVVERVGLSKRVAKLRPLGVVKG
ncbi:RtcB family protein [Coprothermobacteraceae bacterium]|nr:RtcB family protein [Coprothermobacteraceae bacterium]